MLKLDGHFLNLPVLDAGVVVGMVDVLKLTYATLEQVRKSDKKDFGDVFLSVNMCSRFTTWKAMTVKARNWLQLEKISMD